MNKKNVFGVMFFAGLLGLVVIGMVKLQPEKRVVEQAEVYELRGFPAVASEIR